MNPECCHSWPSTSRMGPNPSIERTSRAPKRRARVAVDVSPAFELRPGLQRYDEVSMSPKKETQKAAKTTTGTNKKSKGFTAEERAAMKERAQELKTEARRGRRADAADGERDVLAKIAEMPEPDRAMAKRLHAIINTSAPALSPKTWYGMPAYAKDGKVVCFFQSAQKFKSRYATFGFSDQANLDEGAMWPTALALKELTAAEEARIGALVKKAVSRGLMAPPNNALHRMPSRYALGFPRSLRSLGAGERGR